MKKTIMFITVCLLVLALSGAAFAEGTVITPGSSSTGTMQVRYEVAPYYTVSIPATVDLARGDYESDGHIVAESVVLGHDQALEVSLISTFLANSRDSSDYQLPFTVTRDSKKVDNDGVVATFVPGSDDQSSALHFTAAPPAVDGDYTGTVTFTFRLVDAPAGE